MNEKMMILKMLEEGKISAEEAGKLLESIGKKTSVKSEPDYKETASNNNRHTTESSRVGLDDFAKDFGKKFESFAKDMEPRISKLTEIVVEKTANVADKISKTLQPSDPPIPSSSSTYKPVQNTQIGTLEKDFEAFVTGENNELNMSGLNGNVLLKGYNGDKITAKIFYKSKKSGTTIELMKLGNKFFLNYEEDAFEKVIIDAYIPEGLFNNINVQTINGQLNLSNISTKNIYISNDNGNIELKNINSKNIKLDCNNGNLALTDINSESGQIENFNGNTQSNNLDIANLKLVGFNGSINLNMHYFSKFSEYKWLVETSNGKMTLNLPSATELGYHVKAHTTLGNIKIGLTGLNYIFNESSYVEAKSISLNTAEKKVELSLETSNASLTVN